MSETMKNLVEGEDVFRDDGGVGKIGPLRSEALLEHREYTREVQDQEALKFFQFEILEELLEGIMIKYLLQMKWLMKAIMKEWMELCMFMQRMENVNRHVFIANCRAINNNTQMDIVVIIVIYGDNN